MGRRAVRTLVTVCGALLMIGTGAIVGPASHAATNTIVSLTFDDGTSSHPAVGTMLENHVSKSLPHMVGMPSVLVVVRGVPSWFVVHVTVDVSIAGSRYCVLVAPPFTIQPSSTPFTHEPSPQPNRPKAESHVPE